ncbi:MAG: rhomboid family intramembrane serine protease [Rhodobacteraceae bacterium]|jgi:membrane associated rhomboid family serine protease|nr:rhomboid family intramembrane serine protease [Paracoccaceae bacterium]
MFPIRDHNPSDRTPFVTYLLIAANVIVFAITWPMFQDPAALERLYYTWGLVPRISEPATFVTSMFLHGGVMHLLGNMLFLWIFGDNLEEEMGHVGFLAFYLAGGIAAAGLQVMADPRSMIPMVGASGAIAGVMGGYLLLFPKARVDVLLFLIIIIRVIPVRAWIMLGVWFALQLVGGYSANSQTGGVAYWAHAGGFVAGFLLTLPLWLRRGGTAFWDRTEGHPPHPARQYRFARTGVPPVRRR